jgi:hypothetical protein
MRRAYEEECQRRQGGCVVKRTALAVLFASSALLAQAPPVSVPSQPAPTQPRPRDEGPNRAASDAGPQAAREAARDAGKPGPLKDASAPLPPGHPTTDGSDPANPHANANPHGGGNGADPHGGADPEDDGMPQIPKDTSADDPSIAKGTIVARAVDGNGKPIPKAEITLGILENSVAKGENRKRVLRIADENGIATFDGLTTGSGIAYRIMSLKDGATFSMMPFQLGDTGRRAELHVYPVVEDITKASVVVQSAVFFEVKDDRVQAEQAFMFFNFGKSAWKPINLVVPLPKGHRAVTAQQGMTDVGVDPVENEGVRIRGTFGPGEHQVSFRWQLPYEGEDTLKVDLGMPPNLATSRVITAASPTMKLQVDGFPPALDRTNEQGERVLITEKRLERGDKLDRIDISVTGIPLTGIDNRFRWALTIATLLAIAWACYTAIRQNTVGTAKRAGAAKDTRERILETLLELERGHKTGDVGPKTYEKEKRVLIDELARTFG